MSTQFYRQHYLLPLVIAPPDHFGLWNEWRDLCAWQPTRVPRPGT